MNQSRSEFLTGAIWMGAAAMAAGCMSKGSAVCGIGDGAGGVPMRKQLDGQSLLVGEGDAV